MVVILNTGFFVLLSTSQSDVGVPFRSFKHFNRSSESDVRGCDSDVFLTPFCREMTLNILARLEFVGICGALCGGSSVVEGLKKANTY